MHSLKLSEIKSRLESFRNLGDEKYIDEFIFCLLTPASNAKKCWEAVGVIRKEDVLTEERLREILKGFTRFHNNKARYIINALGKWEIIRKSLGNRNRKEQRNSLAENVEGYGLKEAGHFLRNIGKSDNQLAILDRHILKNLKLLGIISSEKISGKKQYLKVEEKYLKFADEIKIPADELDLLFWSRETGEIFK